MRLEYFFLNNVRKGKRKSIPDEWNHEFGDIAQR
jgi:hypothetical protein